MNTDFSRALLIHPLGYKVETARDDISRLANVMPPLGLLSIAAWLEKHGLATDVVDYFARPDSDRRVREYVREKKPGFVGLSATTSSFLDAARICELVKAERPQTFTVVGGAHASALGEALLDDFPAVDFLVRGEGEETMRRLVESRGENVGEIGGVCFRDADGRGRFSGPAELIPDLDALPFPAYEKLDGYPRDYPLPLFNYPRAPGTSALSSRGCPYACSYCDRSVFGRTYRFNSARYLFEHMRHLNERFGIRHVNFYDDQFTFRKKRVHEFLDLLTERPLPMTFNCAVRSNHIDEDLMRRLAAAGCWMVSLGIETGDAELLSRHRRQTDLETMAARIRMIKSCGIRVKGLLMMGLPGETETSIRRTMEYVFALPLDDFNLTKFTPFPGSPVYREIKEGKGFDEDWPKMDCMHFLYEPDGVSIARMEELFTEFYKRRFTSPRVMWDYVTMLWRSPHSWLRFVRHMRAFLRFARSDSRFGPEAH